MLNLKNCKTHFFLSLGLYLFHNNALAIKEVPDFPVLKQNFGQIQTIVLTGSHEQMGFKYGQTLQKDLKKVLLIIKDFYIRQRKIPYSELIKKAEIFYQRFPWTYQLFIQGEARGANLSLNDAKILNAMETLQESLLTETNQCAFIAIPGNKTKSHFNLIGRNYDYPPPFDQLSKYLVITVMRGENTIPTAFIGIAGEIYCPNCINANGLFMELNNGMQSGGYSVDVARQSLLINMLLFLQNSISLSQLENQLNATQSDYSLIINISDKTHTKSYEFSSTHGLKVFSPKNDQVFVSTNFFLNKSWNHIPKPIDNMTWQGITRRNNLLKLASEVKQFDVRHLESLMDKKIEDGGAIWKYTIYQLIFDSSDYSLYVKINKLGNKWNRIPLKKLF